MRKATILIPEKNFPNGGDSQCKGSEAEICLVCLKMIKGISGWRRQRKGNSRGDWGRDKERGQTVGLCVFREFGMNCGDIKEFQAEE